MHDSKKPYFKFAVFAVLCSVTMSVIAGPDPENPNAKNIRPWIERPWAWRYLLFIRHNWDNHKKWAEKYNEKIGPQALRRQWTPLFDATRFLQSNGKGAHPGNGFSVVVIEFDKEGKVTTPNAFGKPLNGRIDQNMQVTLAEGDSDVDRQFDIGHWFLGLGDASTHWAPSICLITHMPSPFYKTDTTYLYGPKFEISGAFPTVGCREWAYQIKDPGRPYIDVTSYTPKRFDPYGSGNYIQETIGWAGFEDHKPIIGKHEDDWYCLHDCPGDDQPGIIPNIKAWAKRNGWKAPQPPTRVPVFPDPPAKSGYYP
jgi:hypothetical protein